MPFSEAMPQSGWVVSPRQGAPIEMADTGEFHVSAHGISRARTQDGTMANAVNLADKAAGPIRSAFPPAMDEPLDIDPEGLARWLVADLRSHPHLCNVLTHVGGANWNRIERSLRIILHPAASPDNLTPLAQHILELMCSERGVTGRVLKPYLHELFAKGLPRPIRNRVLGHIAHLFEALQADVAYRCSDK